MRGARLGRGRPNRPVIVRNGLVEPAPPEVVSRPVVVVSPHRSRPRARCVGTRIVLRAPLEPYIPPPASPDPVTYRISGPHKKWVIGMALERVEAMGRQEIPFDVSAFQDGDIYDPTVATVSAAFLADSRAKPGPGDWVPCTWGRNLIGTYVALCLVGAGGSFAPAAGSAYWAWVQIDNPATNELVVEQVGRLIAE